jgi:hypothetical protein
VTAEEIAAARRSPLSPLGSGEERPDLVAGGDEAAAAVADHNLR